MCIHISTEGQARDKNIRTSNRKRRGRTVKIGRVGWITDYTTLFDVRVTQVEYYMSLSLILAVFSQHFALHNGYKCFYQKNIKIDVNT